MARRWNGNEIGRKVGGSCAKTKKNHFLFSLAFLPWEIVLEWGILMVWNPTIRRRGPWGWIANPFVLPRILPTPLKKVLLDFFFVKIKSTHSTLLARTLQRRDQYKLEWSNKPSEHGGLLPVVVSREDSKKGLLPTKESLWNEEEKNESMMKTKHRLN